MADNSVGMISLDLVIREKLGEQLEKIKARVSSPAEKIGEAVEEAIEKPMKNAGKAVADSVSKAMDEANRAMDNGIEDAVSRAAKRYEEQRKELEETLNKPIKPRVVPAGPKFMPYDSSKITQEIEENNKKMQEKATKPVKETIDKAKNMLKDFKVNSEPTARLKQEVELLTEKLGLLQKKYQELSAADPSDKAAAQIIKVKQQIISTQEQIDKLNGELSKTGEKISSAADKASSKIKSVLGKAFSHVRNAGSKALSALGSRFKGIGKSAADSMKPVRKLGNTLKNTFRRVFLIAGIYAAFRALKDGFLSAAKADEEFNKSLNEVKANLAIAFTPIMQAVMPALNSLMSGLAAVTRQVAAFIAGLFGTTYKQAAEATKKLKGVTEAAKKAKLSAAGIDEMNILSSGSDDSGSSSGTDYSKIDMSEPELPDWAEKLKTAIRSGDWAGVGAVFAERVNAAFSAVNWDSISAKVNAGVRKVTDGINGFLDRFSEIGGWETLGETVAGGLNTITGAIDTFYRTVKWDKLGSGIARGLNRAINKTNWKQLGSAFAGHLQAMIETAFAFVKEFDFEGLGSGIGDAVNGWFDRVDFGMAAQTLSLGIIGIFSTVSASLQRINFRGIGGKIAEFLNNIDIPGILGSFAQTVSRLVNGALELLIGFVENTDWMKFGSDLFDSIGAMLSNIDWVGLVSRAFELLGAAVGGAVLLAGTLIEKAWGVLVKAWNGIKGYFAKKIDECGGNIVAGIFAGIIDGLANVGSWIKDHIFKPFIDGFKKAFGIASPSKEMATMGGYLIDGLYNAVSKGIQRIREIFEKMLRTIKSVFSGVHEWFGEKFSAAWDGIKNAFSGAGGWFSDRWSDITSAFSAVGSFFRDKFSDAWSGIKDIFSDPKSFFSGVWEGIKSCFGSVVTWFRNKFSDAWDAVRNVFSTGGMIFQGIAENIAGVFKDTVNSLIDGINWVIAQPFNAINDALGGLRDIELLGGHPFGWLPWIDVPEIPHLAKGGLAAAPTLAMVGDNPNAAADPEVIAPLSKLMTMLENIPELAEIAELLREIIRMLRSGISATIDGSVLGSGFARAVLKIIADDKARRGK